MADAELHDCSPAAQDDFLGRDSPEHQDEEQLRSGVPEAERCCSPGHLGEARCDLADPGAVQLLGYLRERQVEGLYHDSLEHSAGPVPQDDWNQR